MQAIGTALAKMHGNLIVHGDLTTSNMMLRPLPGQTPNFELVSLSSCNMFRIEDNDETTFGCLCITGTH